MASAAVSRPVTTSPVCPRRRAVPSAIARVYSAMRCRSRSVEDRELSRSARSVAQGLRSVSRPQRVAVTPPGDALSTLGGEQEVLLLGASAGAQRAEQVVVQPRDGLHRDALRAGEGALADVRAAAEALG